MGKRERHHVLRKKRTKQGKVKTKNLNVPNNFAEFIIDNVIADQGGKKLLLPGEGK
jgi:hypothetical protein